MVGTKPTDCLSTCALILRTSAMDRKMGICELPPPSLLLPLLLLLLLLLLARSGLVASVPNARNLSAIKAPGGRGPCRRALVRSSGHLARTVANAAADSDPEARMEAAGGADAVTLSAHVRANTCVCPRLAAGPAARLTSATPAAATVAGQDPDLLIIIISLMKTGHDMVGVNVDRTAKIQTFKSQRSTTTTATTTTTTTTTTLLHSHTPHHRPPATHAAAPTGSHPNIYSPFTLSPTSPGPLHFRSFPLHSSPVALGNLP